MNRAHVDELARIELDDGFVWRPVRRRFGIRAFGVNVYTPGQTGRVIEEHTESTFEHEELYVVLRGRVRFTVGDDEHELAQGQAVFIRDPALRRGAIAVDDDAVVLALGGRPGAPHEVSAWEAMFAAVPAMREGDWDEAIRLHGEALAEHPGDPRLLYNLACMEARAGHRVDALLHLQQAVALDVRWGEYAAADSDFASIRDEPGFPS